MKYTKLKIVGSFSILLLFLPIGSVLALDYAPDADATQTATEYHVIIYLHTSQVGIENYSFSVTSMPSGTKLFQSLTAKPNSTNIGFDIQKESIPSNDTDMVVEITLAFNPPLIDGITTIYIRTWDLTLTYSNIPLEAATATAFLPFLFFAVITIVFLSPIIFYQRRKKIMKQANKIPVVRKLIRSIK